MRGAHRIKQEDRVIAELQSVTVATVAGEKRFRLGVFPLKVMAKGGGKIVETPY